MQKVNDGQGVAVTTIPNRPSPNNIFVFSSHGDPAKAGQSWSCIELRYVEEISYAFAYSLII